MGYRDNVVGTFFSKEYIKKHVLKLTQEEIDNMDQQIEIEKASGGEQEDQWAEYNPAEERPDLKLVTG